MLNTSATDIVSASGFDRLDREMEAILAPDLIRCIRESISEAVNEGGPWEISALRERIFAKAIGSRERMPLAAGAIITIAVNEYFRSGR